MGVNFFVFFICTHQSLGYLTYMTDSEYIKFAFTAFAREISAVNSMLYSQEFHDECNAIKSIKSSNDVINVIRSKFANPDDLRKIISAATCLLEGMEGGESEEVYSDY
jgi:hypothetical protein